jgi:hypothetical protein
MSGGSLNYVYIRVEEAAENIPQTTVLRRALRTHLHLVAKALHDIEWVDSADYGPGDEDEAIRAVLSPGAVLAQAVADAKAARAELDAELARVAS